MTDTPWIRCPRRTYQTYLVVFLSIFSLILPGCSLGLNAGSPSNAAPIVIDVLATRCELSIQGTYAAIGTNTSFGWYDLESQTKVPIVLPPSADATVRGLWLTDDQWFAYFPITYTASMTMDIPTDGWLIDVTHGVVTHVLDLDPQAQMTIMHHAIDMLKTYHERMNDGHISPDGRWIARDATIAVYTGPPIVARDGTSPYDGNFFYSLSGKEQHSFITGRNIKECLFGWKADSSGYYFIDQTIGVRSSPPGPVRFLPVTPMK